MVDKLAYIERKKTWNLLQYLKQSHLVLQGLLEQKALEEAEKAMEGCQNCAIVIGNQTEAFLGEGSDTVHDLEDYCEFLYQLSQAAQNSLEIARIGECIDAVLGRADKDMKRELELNKIVLLYQVDFKNILNDDDLLEKKIHAFFEMLDENPEIIGWWYVDLTELLKWKFVREAYMERCKRLFEEWGGHKACILDMSRNADLAFDLSDAYYGDITELYSRFCEAEKPVMIQDINCFEEQQGYYNSEYRERIQKVELDLFHEFQRVCDKYDIKYFAYAGTMLGAVRHHGFIPWDDDIDVLMFRQDYERLQAVAEKEFTGKYFLQCPLTDPAFLFPGADLRNSETTSILLSTVKRDVNLGMFMDIFILDSMPDDNAKFKRECEMLNFYYSAYERRMRYLINPLEIELEKDERIKKLAKREDFYNVVKECDRKRSTYDEDNSVYVTIFSELVMAGHPVIYERAWFENAVWIPFEDTRIPVPSGYGEILQRAYSEYMIAKRGYSSHGDTFFDVDRGYESYLAAEHK